VDPERRAKNDSMARSTSREICSRPETAFSPQDAPDREPRESRPEE
jgi:hypothetical protein